MSPEKRPKSFGTFEKQAPVNKFRAIFHFVTIVCTSLTAGDVALFSNQNIPCLYEINDLKIYSIENL